jgi:hypothetical protein
MDDAGREKNESCRRRNRSAAIRRNAAVAALSDRERGLTRHTGEVLAMEELKKEF